MRLLLNVVFGTLILFLLYLYSSGVYILAKQLYSLNIVALGDFSLDNYKLFLSVMLKLLLPLGIVFIFEGV